MNLFIIVLGALFIGYSAYIAGLFIGRAFMDFIRRNGHAG